MNINMNSTIAKYILAVAFLTLAVFLFLKEDYISLMRRVDLLDILISCACCFSIFSVTGMKIAAVTKSQYNKQFHAEDIFGLPIMMNLWSYIIPFKSGTLFILLFLKMKYGVKAAQGVSISLYSQLITFVLYGIMSLVYFIYKGALFSVGSLIALLLILAPVFIYIMGHWFRKLPEFKNKFLSNIREIIGRVSSGHNELWHNASLVLTLFVLAVAHTILRVVWVYFVTRIFDMNISLLLVVCMAFLTELSIVIRFIPGNLGVYELMSGGLFEVMGANAGVGIFIAVFLRLTTLILTFTIGVWSLQRNMHYFHLSNFKAMFNAIKTARSEA